MPDTFLSICYGHTDQTVLEVQANNTLLIQLDNMEGYFISISYKTKHRLDGTILHVTLHIINVSAFVYIFRPTDYSFLIIFCTVSSH